jgi:hypothetical protein
MTDVVEKGRDDRPGRGPAAVRPVALVLLVLAGLFVLSRSGLLSADSPPDGGTGRNGTAAEVHRLVARVDDRLVRPAQADGSGGARLPDGLAAQARLVPVLTGDASSVLVGVHEGLLFRLAPTRDARWQPIGRARAVVAAGAAPGRVLVLRAGGVAEVEVATGRVAQPAPFPGFAEAAGWRPEGVVSAVGTRSLLVSRPLPDGVGQELALAWPARRVEAGTNPPLQVLGSYRALLGVADDWILTSAGACPGSACRVRIVSVTRDAVLARDVAPPPGWSFLLGTSGGRTREALVPVQRIDDGRRALARLVAGGDNALLVQGSAGVDLDAGLVGDLDGSVRLVTRAGDGAERVRTWSPLQPARAEPLGDGSALPDDARLVCVCG